MSNWALTSIAGVTVGDTAHGTVISGTTSSPFDGDDTTRYQVTLPSGVGNDYELACNFGVDRPVRSWREFIGNLSQSCTVRLYSATALLVEVAVTFDGDSGLLDLGRLYSARSIALHWKSAGAGQVVSAWTLEARDDVGTATGGLPPGALTSADVSNQLAAWLSDSDGTHSDSTPLLDHAALATVASVVGSTAGQLDAVKSTADTTSGNVSDVKTQQADWAFGLGAAAHGYYADVKTLIGNIKSITDTLPTPLAQLTSIVLDHYTADIAGILAQIDTVLSNLGAQSTDLSGTAGSAVGALSGRTGFPATGWSMSAEEDFEDAIAFAEAADAYVLTITSYQDTQPANTSPAGLWLPRLGWWCVLNGSLASQRQFVDFEQMLLDDQGRRMPGCAIQLRPGTLATVQAWLLA